MKTYRQIADVELSIAADLSSFATVAAQLFTSRALNSIECSGRFSVALSGGSTPTMLFAQLAKDNPTGLNWQKVHCFWSDERCVPPTDAASNYFLAKDQLLDHVPVPFTNVHRIQAEEPATAAQTYEAELRSFFHLAPGLWPRFDLILLGIGEEGHTASLFPGTAALRDTVHMVTSNFVPSLDAERITLTFPTINAAACVLVLANGARKSAIIRTALDSPPKPEVIPMQGVRPRTGQLLWLLDVAAAADLCCPPGSVVSN